MQEENYDKECEENMQILMYVNQENINKPNA